MPTAGSDVEAARRQLERVLRSPGFSRNERLSRFLRFIVEQHLAGRDAEIKESLIAIEVLGRTPDYDPKQDSIVRTEAARLRARLSEYYLSEGKSDPLVIELPKGGYVPVIRGEPETSESVPAPAGTKLARPRLWVVAALACLIVVLVGVAWWLLHPQNAPIPIAVLPLANLNQDPANDYFADGLTSEIIRNLTIIEGLAVRSEASSFVFKGKPQKARDAGKQLEADYLVEGSVLRSGQRLRINVELIRARDDFPMWSGHYEREMADIFAIQDEISRGVVNNLRLKLGRGRRRYETSTEAYDLYLRGRALAIQFSGNPARRIPVFEQAIATDPSFAPAYAALAVAHLTLSGQSPNDPANEVARMRAAAEKAVELDPFSAESYVALGAAFARQAQWDQAEKSFRRAIEIEPGLLESHGWFAMYYFLPLDRIEEAIRQLRIAEKSSPLFTFFLADALADAGRNDEAAEICGRLPPEYTGKSQCAPGALVRQGKGSEVIHDYGAGNLPRNSNPVEAALACAYSRAGRRDEAEKAAGLAGFYSTVAFTCMGDKDRAFEAFDSHAALGPIRIGWFLLRADRENPGLLRGDPRFKALRKKVGLPE
jgi:adenylate cyclase